MKFQDIGIKRICGTYTKSEGIVVKAIELKDCFVVKEGEKNILIQKGGMGDGNTH